MKSREKEMFIPQGGEDQSPLLYKNDYSAGLIQLSILKMDNTSFDIRVSRRASVRELKRAVQREFGASQGEEEGKISWGHVWGNFCLTYQAYKLVDDSSLLSSFGIKDSDQLCFIRHFSSANQGEKLHPRKHGRFPPFRKKTFDGANVPRGGKFTQIELHWMHVLKTWLSYSKVWIIGMKPDWKNLHLKQ